MADPNRVSIIIPCRNEEAFIERCLDSIGKMDYPREFPEALVVDGMSDDRTRALIDACANRYPFIRREVDPLRCHCGGTMRVVAFIVDPTAIRKILQHRPRPRARAHAPPAG